jgi:hypothetical protein
MQARVRSSRARFEARSAPPLAPARAPARLAAVYARSLGPGPAVNFPTGRPGKTPAD